MLKIVLIIEYAAIAILRYQDNVRKISDTANKMKQVAKTVTDLVNSRIEPETIMEYNAQGRMAKITIMTYVDGSLAKIVTQEYEYDSSGIKVKQTETVDADADGTIDSGKITEYLNVKQNHTGYSQVLEEYLSEDGDPMKVTTLYHQA